MKKTLILALLAAASTQSVFSQPIIDITGSTAGRSAVHAAILALLTNETYAFDGTSSASSATRAIYHGTFGGNPVIVRTFWTGSAAGVRDVSEQNQLAGFFATSVLGNSAGQNINPATPLATASADTVAEIGFSDVFQTSTEFTANTLIDEINVAVLPFRFVKNDGANPALTNITPPLVRQLYGSLGELPLALFTGNPANQTTLVYASGRDALSGTRITAFAETGLGVFTGVNQYTGTVNSGVITAIAFVGNGGYASGGTLATLLGGTYSSGIVLGYLGISDSNAAITAGATALTYNGVTYTEQNVKEGLYSFWGYLHQSRMTLSGTPLSFYDALAANLFAVPSPGTTIVIGDMEVQRDTDGGPIFPLY